MKLIFDWVIFTLFGWETLADCDVFGLVIKKARFDEIVLWLAVTVALVDILVGRLVASEVPVDSGVFIESLVNWIVDWLAITETI